MKARIQKAERRKIILELLQMETVSSQKTLRERLSEKGIEVNQATLSRDLRDMGVLKVPMGTGGSRYLVSPDIKRSPVRHEAVLRSSVTRVTRSTNVIVVHTAPGNAQAVGLALDNLQIPGILGTVAGDDTVFIVLMPGAEGDGVEQEMKRLLGWQNE